MKMLMAVASASLTLFLAGCERSLIYYPTTGTEERLTAIAASEGLAPWRNDAGERIGWMSGPTPSGGRAAMLVFHGNAGNAADRGYFVRGFKAATRAAPWDVFLFEYPGYGSRSGRPSEEAIMAAAADAVKRLAAQGYASIFLTGESLGSGVACRMAATYPEHVEGLLLVTPFTSLLDLGRHHYPAFLVRLLLRERYDNAGALSQYRGRVAMLIAGEDEIVPAELGRRLYEAYQGPKKLWVQEGRTHNTLSFDPAAPWWREATEFLQAPE